jgi:GT2 family glycosyltransferase/tetratricopeptide (TPR) repeat protein
VGNPAESSDAERHHQEASSPLTSETNSHTEALFESLVAKADHLRDTGQARQAANAYAAALEVAPSRSDIRMQYGNMLKDSGQFSEAEGTYRQLLSETPADADVCLQLGHLLKLTGRREEAIASYEEALRRNPGMHDAERELSFLGQVDRQESLFEKHLQAGHPEALLAFSGEVARMRQTLERMAETLPSIQSQIAFPISLYGTYRQIFDAPPPPQYIPDLHFVILLSIDAETLETLYDQVESLRSQTHTNFTVRVIGRTDDQRRVIDRAAAADPRFSWHDIPAAETAFETEHRLASQSGDGWIVLTASGAKLHREGLAWMAWAASSTTAIALIADEERMNNSEVGSPWVTPVLRHTVDYDTLLQTNPFGETIAISANAYTLASTGVVTSSRTAARSSLLLNLARGGRVGHLPLPLVVRAFEKDDYVAQDHDLAVDAHIEAHHCRDRITRSVGITPIVQTSIVWVAKDLSSSLAVVIPTRDNSTQLQDFVRSLKQHAQEPSALQFLIIDNGPGDPQTEAALEALSREVDIRVLKRPEPFNWSKFNNEAAQASEASTLVFANDDMLMLSSGWDAKLRGLLERDDIGAVGARLLYQDRTVQHAGILFGWQGSVIHDGLYQAETDPGPLDRWHLTRQTGAVTGAFLATRRSTFLKAGGFDALQLPIAYSDVDYCLRLRAQGMKVLYTPVITALHWESKTRGLDHLHPEKHARNMAERQVVSQRWHSAFYMDVSVNPLWHAATLPFRLISAPSPGRLSSYISKSCMQSPWIPTPTQWPGNRASPDPG